MWRRRVDDCRFLCNTKSVGELERACLHGDESAQWAVNHTIERRPASYRACTRANSLDTLDCNPQLFENE